MKPNSVLSAATILIRPHICHRRQKLLSKIISCAVNFHAIESRLFRSKCRLRILFFNVMNLFNSKLSRCLIRQLHHRGIWHRHCTRCNWLHSRYPAKCPAPRMADLQETFCSLCMNYLRQPLHPGNVFVIIKNERISCIFPQWCIDTSHFHNNKSDATSGSGSIMFNHCVIDKSIVRLIHPHSTHDDSVFQFYFSNAAR